MGLPSAPTMERAVAEVDARGTTGATVLLKKDEAAGAGGATSESDERGRLDEAGEMLDEPDEEE